MLYSMQKIQKCLQLKQLWNSMQVLIELVAIMDYLFITDLNWTAEKQLQPNITICLLKAVNMYIYVDL